MDRAVLIDTSFFLRFLNEKDPLFKNADNYFRYFIEQRYSLIISTITIAEYCIGGSIDQLPLKNLQILPFNINHAKRTGEFAKILFEIRRKGEVNFKERTLIPNDSKLFAQADTEIGIDYFVTSDSESLKAYSILKQHDHPKFQIIDINKKYTDVFGIIDFN